MFLFDKTLHQREFRIRYFIHMQTETVIAGHRVIIRRKRVKNMNMRLQDGAEGGLVCISAPTRVPLQEIAAFVTEKSDWIRRNSAKLAARAPKSLSYEAGTLHLLWGAAYPLRVSHVGRGQKAVFDGTAWQLYVRADAPPEKRAALLEAAYKQQLIVKAGPLMARWADEMGLNPRELKTQRMTSRWGSCHVSRGVIKLSSELARKDVALLEYVLVHELVHLFERGHNARFYGLMDKYLPDWKARKQRLNAVAT